MHSDQNLPLDAAALHPLALDSRIDGGSPMAPAMALALAAHFGTVERWRDTFTACAEAAGGQAGWLLLLYQPREGTLLNQWVGMTGSAVAGALPMLALALPGDDGDPQHRGSPGTDLDAALGDIDWAAAYVRYQRAVHAASEPMGASPDEAAGALLLDVRRAGVFEQAVTMIAGARWCDPTAVGHWSGDLPAGQELVVYCVHGHEVSRATAVRLRAAGLNARYLRGGIEAWQAAGRPLVDKPASQTASQTASPTP